MVQAGVEAQSKVTELVPAESTSEEPGLNHAMELTAHSEPTIGVDTD